MEGATIGLIVTSSFAFVGVCVQTIMNYREKSNNLKFQIAQAKYKEDQDTKEIALKKEIADRADVSDAKLEIKFQLIVDKQQEIEKQVFFLRETILSHILTEEEKEKLKTEELRVDSAMIYATEGQTQKIVEDNFTLSIHVKAVINKWGTLMLRLASKFSKSDTRKQKAIDRSKELIEKQELIINEFKDFVDLKLPEIKNDKGSGMSFSAFMDKQKMFASFESLISDLEKNGLSPDEYVEKFRVQVIKFCRNLITAVTLWEDMIDITLANKRAIG